MCQSDKIERTVQQQARAVDIHDKSREDLLKRQLSNNESYDKAILSLSSAGLALSLTAIKFVIPLDQATNLYALKLSWILFLITIICSLSAYLIGNIAISRQLEIHEDYYIKCLVKAQTENNIYSKINSIFNIVTGVVFACAISLVIYFVIVNLNGDSLVTNKTTPDTTKKVFLTDSASVPKMQLTPGGTDNTTLSADIPSMQLAPGTVPTNTSAPGTTPENTSAAPSDSNASGQSKSE
jgi:hypothetical protein